MTFWQQEKVTRVVMIYLSSVLALAGPAAPARGEALLGAVGHALLNNRFYPEQGPYWQINLTMPLVQELGLKTVHEAIYGLTAPQRALITAGKTDAATVNRVARNRKLVDDWFAVYDAAGTDVVLAVLGSSPTPTSTQANAEFVAWVADFVATHPSIKAVQMHNEANLTQFWQKGTPEDYVDTYRPFAQAIKAKRPDVKILIGGISALWWGPGVAWFKRVVAHGGLDFADGVAAHPYTFDYPPETDPHWRDLPISAANHREQAIKAFSDLVASLNNGRPLPLYFTEFGWSTATTGLTHVDETTQADYLARSVLIFLDVRLSGVPLKSAFWYNLKDNGQKDDQESHRFGLVGYDLKRRKPSFDAMKALAATFSDPDDFAPSALKAAVAAAGFSAKTKLWHRKSDGAEIFAYWATDKPGFTAPRTLRLTLPSAGATSARLHVASDAPPVPVTLQRVGGSVVVDLPATSRPAWLEILP